MTDVIEDALKREIAHFVSTHERSAALAERGSAHMVDGVPVHWMNLYGLPCPLFVSSAHGSRLVDADGEEYLDLGLTGTAARWGHHGSTVRALLQDDPGLALVTGFPTEDAITVSDLLSHRFGDRKWQYMLSASEANRTALRIARLATGRQKIVAFTGSYHGSLDEFDVTVDGVGATVRDPHRPGAAGGATEGTILLPFNDATRLARTLESEDVAAVITEPALTNGGGIARPTPQFLNALRSSTAETGTKLIVDETQSVVLGPGGATAAWQVPSDIVVLGKSFALGLPFGAIGLGEGMAEVLHHTADAHRLAGIGSTLAAGPLSFRAASYALTHLDTPEVTDAVNAVAAQLHHEMAEVITQLEMPWRVDRLGAMVTLSFVPGGLSDGAGLRAQEHTAGLRDLILVGMANRGVLVGSLGGAMVVSPSVTRDDVGRVSHAFSSLSRKVSHVCP